MISTVFNLVGGCCSVPGAADVSSSAGRSVVTSPSSPTAVTRSLAGVTVVSRPGRPGWFLKAAAVVTALLVSGCGNGNGGADDIAAESEIDAAAHQVTVPISAVQTSVENPGAEPRQVLTFRAVPGTAQSVVLRTENDVHQQIDGNASQDFSTAPLAIPLDATARDGGVDLVLGRIEHTRRRTRGEVGAGRGVGGGADRRSPTAP